MNNILVFVKKLHEFTGFKLYVNFFAMVFISFLEGIGILLIVPLLSVVGVFELYADDGMGFFSAVQEALTAIPASLHLPMVVGIFIFLLTGQGWLQRNQSVLSAKIQQNFVRKLRLDLYEAILQADWAFFLQRRRSDFQHVLTDELGRVSHGTSVVLKLVASFVFTGIQIGFALYLSVPMTFIVLLCGGALFLIARKYIAYSREQGKKTTQLSQSYYAGITDQFNGIKDIKSNMLESSYIGWFRKLSAEIETNVVKLAKLQSDSQFLYRAASAVLIGGFIYISLSVFQVRAEQLLVILLIFSRLWPRFTGIQSGLEQIAVTLPSFHSLNSLLRECSAAKESETLDDSLPPIAVEDSVECRNVSFRYQSDRDIFALKNIHVRIPANTMTAIVGKSGAGKSTFVDLLMGLIQPEDGEVVVDGRTLSPVLAQRMRRSIGYVPQDPFLFHTSVRENLMLVAPNATEEQLWEALRFSASDEFVKRLPMGLDTVIGDRGVRLSGGERQRIVLARAILRKPSILVLDEATSALDSENEKYIQEAIQSLRGEMTVIVIAHRLSTIRNADQILVMEQGSIVQQGAMAHLTKDSKGVFTRMLNLQQS